MVHRDEKPMVGAVADEEREGALESEVVADGELIGRVKRKNQTCEI